MELKPIKVEEYEKLKYRQERSCWTEALCQFLGNKDLDIAEVTWTNEDLGVDRKYQQDFRAPDQAAAKLRETISRNPDFKGKVRVSKRQDRVFLVRIKEGQL